MNTPCKDCVERHENCHSGCEKYIGWRLELDARREKIIKAKSDDVLANTYRGEVLLRMMPHVKKKRKR